MRELPRMWETQKMLAQDHEVELVRQAERLNRRGDTGDNGAAWKARVARVVNFVLRRRPKSVPQQLPATND
jgi:hypothetical protein